MNSRETLLRFISEQGYKRNSPDKNRPFNIIPSNNITMQGVDFPVLGISNTGHVQKMYPGMDYEFEGESVFEIPMKKQFGGDMKFWRPVLQTGGQNSFTVSGNPFVIPSQGSYPLEYRDRGDKDVDGVPFSAARIVSRVDAQGKPLTRNQIAENQLMWNMQKQAYSPQQQLFNNWKNNPENTEQGFYNMSDWEKYLKSITPTGENIPLEGLEIDKANKRGKNKGSCSTGEVNKGECLDDNKQFGGELPIAQRGKQIKPLYVESKNDPRYKAYRDSLNLYNSYKKVENALKKQGYSTGDGMSKSGSRPITRKSGIEYEKMLTVNSKNNKNNVIKNSDGTYYVRDFENMMVNKSLPYQLFNKNIQPLNVRRYFDDDMYTYVNTPSYMELNGVAANLAPTRTDIRNVYNYSNVNPKQQVIVKDPNAPKYRTVHTSDTEGRFELVERPKIEALQNNLQPEDVVSNFDIEASTPIARREFIAPKYYNVEDVVNRGKSQTNYKWYPRNQDALRELSEEAGDRRTMTPVYKTGGLLSRTITCQNCGWSWKAADGGNDVSTCHKCGTKNKIMQVGGSIDEEAAMRGMMKSKIGMGNAFNHPAIKRMSQAMPKTGMTPEGIGTHYMSSVDNYAVPELQDLGEEELTLVDPDPRSREAIRFNSPEEAEYFAKHYKEVAPMSTIFKGLQEYQMGGASMMYADRKYQTAGTVKYGTPEYAEAYNKGEVITDKGVRSPIALDEVVIQGRPLTEFGKTRKQIAEKNSWEQFANERFLGNFEKNMGQTLENLPEYRKQEYEDYIDKLAFDEYIKTHPKAKGEKRGEYIDRIQNINANSSNFERAYEANAEYNPSTDINAWRKGLIGLGSFVLGPDTINRMKQSSRYYSTKEKNNMQENPVSSMIETTVGTLAPLEIPGNMLYGQNNSWTDALSGRGTSVPMEARVLGDPLMLLGEAAPLLMQGYKGLRGPSAITKGLSEQSTLSKLDALKQVSNPVQNVAQETAIVKPWQVQELPGLHLQSTMSDGPISKIVEPKTGLINVEQALGIINKESSGPDKVALIKQAFGENIPKKMDYNEFRKTVQDQLVPLEQQFSIKRSDYGIDNIGYTPKIQGSAFDRFSTFMNTPLNELFGPKLLENQTLILSNANKFGRGSSAHDNPIETLGHIHFFRDSKNPDVLTVTQIQSDAFQGTHRIMSKTQEESLQNYNKLKEEAEEVYDMFNDGTESSNAVLNNYEKSLQLAEASLKNFTQKQLLDKSHQERYLQELVNYAGKRGDVNKVRVPTSDTASKIQYYTKDSQYELESKLANFERRFSDSRDGVTIYNDNAGGTYIKNNDGTYTYQKTFDRSNSKVISESEFNDVVNPARDKINELKTLLKDHVPDYTTKQKTILKKYSEQPKLIKKLFGQDAKIVTDSKGNTWYEFDIPETFKQGKGEIRAFRQGGTMNNNLTSTQLAILIKQQADKYITKN